MAYLNSEQKKAVKSTILECRGILEKDIEQVLINLGIYINEEWIDINNLTNLNEEQKKIRENIDQVIEKLGKGGFEKNKAVKEYIKEVAYTYLNRISALRVLEARGLIDELLITRSEHGDKSFINSRFYEVAREYCKYNVDAGLGYIINLMFEEIGEEIKLLFNTEDEYSFIAPSSNGLLSIIKLLCTDIDEESWKQDEIIGWIYEFFNSLEKKDIFGRQNEKDFFISVDEVPATTQVFTPQWVVNWILDNTLTRYYNDIKKGERECKDVTKITLLDPCCGSGHFLVKAFDIFCDIYKDAGIKEDEIPYRILNDNLYGIDIDFRAIQLTTLILFIKVKSYLKERKYDINTKNKIKVNLVCADAILLNDNNLIEWKLKHEKSKTILKFVDVIYEEFKDIRLKGSLIQPEKKLYELFEEYKDKIAKSQYIKYKKVKNKQDKAQIEIMEGIDQSFKEFKSNKDYSKEEQDLFNSLAYVYNEAIKANDLSKKMFATEAQKSVKLVDIFMKKEGYDIVVTNPPYMGNGNMDEKLKEFVNTYYKEGSEDLYSAFIMRCEQFLEKNGLLGMIVQQGFMFTSKYSKLRENILDNNQIVEVVQLGTNVFDELKGEKVNSVMFVLGKAKDTNRISTFIDISEEKNRELFPDIQYKKYLINQEKFRVVKNTPFVYKLSESILDCFKKSNFSKIAQVQRGLSTYNNEKYIKYYWEVENKNRWKWIDKVSGNDRYLSLDNTVVDFNENAIKFYKGNGGYSGENYFFKKGIFYPRSPYKSNFSAKFLKEDTLIEDDKPGIFLHDAEDTEFLLGILNSNLIIFFLNIINPTNHYQVGDINRLPIKEFSVQDKTNIKSLVLENIKLTHEKLALVEVSRYFDPITINCKFKQDIKLGLINILKKKDELQLQIYKNDIMIDDIVYLTYGLEDDEIAFIESQNGIIKNNDLEKSNYAAIIDEDNDVNYDLLSKKINLKKNILLEKRIKEELYGNKALKKELQSLINYFMGLIFGRFKDVDINNNHGLSGIIPLDSSIYFEEDLLEQIINVIAILFGEQNVDDFIIKIEKILDKSIEKYLVDDLFKEHIKQFEKRPIYWHICSPKKTFNCFVYYKKLDEDTLYKVKGIYLVKMIERYEEDLKYYNDQLLKARIDDDKNREKDYRNKCNDVEGKLEDLNILDEKIMNILTYKPNIDEGVLNNIIPIESILAARVSTDKEREEYYKEVKKK